MMAAFISLEVGFIFNLHIGLFPLVSMTSILLFTPSEVWDWLESVSLSVGARPHAL